MNKVSDEKVREREEQFEDRWTSFGKHTGILKIHKRMSAQQLKQFEVFKDYDDRFLEKISPDISLAVWDRQKVLFEEGSYIDLAFFVVKGYVNIYIQKQQGQNALAQPIFDNHQTRILDTNGGRKKNSGGRTVFQTQIKQLKQNDKITFLTSMDIDLPWGETLNLGAGEIFGEIGASIGWPQSVTAQTTSECVLVQIRTPALDKMKRRSKVFKQKLDEIYIERALSSQLKSTPLFQRCSDKFIEGLKKKVDLKSFKGKDVIAREGEPADAIYLVRSGFVKLLQRFGDGEIVVNYLSKGMILGDIEFLLKHTAWVYTAVSVENTELVRFRHEDFKAVIDKYPEVQGPLWESAAARVKQSGFNRRNIGKSEFINMALEKGLVEGNSVLVIDLDTCTRCDDCVRGCADTHDGLPRFVREGEKYNDFLITRACYHCQDPVCLIGCPTGAIRRAGVSDVVEIDAQLCIGCKVCFNNCPYSAIIMVESETVSGGHAELRPTGNNVTELATKCDLCHNSGHEPACVSNCPHGCAIRVTSIENFSRVLFRNRKNRKRRRSYRLDKIVQSPGWLYAFLAATALCIFIYFLNIIISEVNSGNVWGLSYGTAAAILMVGASLYGARRRMMNLAAKFGLGKSFSWVQFHVYGGTLFMLLVLMHSGFRMPNGPLHSWLWIMSVWVTASGLLGIVIQKWVPTMLCSALAIEVIYERIPELIREIRENADSLVSTCSEPVKDFYRKKIAASLRSPKPKPIYFVDITGGIQRRLKQFDFLRNVLSDKECQKLNRLELMYKSKLEMDAHYTLQKMLRWWLYLHLPASIVLLVLVAIHLFAVFYY